MSKREIVKVQVSIFSTDGERRVLIYNEDGSIHEEFPLTADLEREMGKSLKRYFYAHVSKKKKLVLDGAAPRQAW